MKAQMTPEEKERKSMEKNEIDPAKRMNPKITQRHMDAGMEIGSVLGVGKQSAELAFRISREFAKENGIEVPDGTPRLLNVPEVFEWVDDGKRDLRLRINDSNGDFIAETKVK